MQVICTIPVMFSYDAKPNDCLEISQFLNDDIATTVNAYPDKFIGLATVPMQDTLLAVQELERCMSMGFKGVQIGSNVNNINLGEAQFHDFWAACEKLNAAILVHPWQMMGQEHMTKYWLPWLVGMPAEISRAICSMIFGGIFEKFPKLKVCFAHGGGSFLPTISRIEHGWDCRPDLVAIDNEFNPKKYLGKFWVDSITHDIDALKYILKMQGSKRVCLGSDYPFPLGDLEIGKFIEESDLPKETIEDIFCHAALEWLELKKEMFFH
jgi:aminocarboxymuconate-semialdehyde decarboxylase